MKNNYSFLKIKKEDFPKNLTIEPTNTCNLNCPLCPTGLNSLNRDNKNMSLKEYKSIIDQAKDKVDNITLYLFGEPFMHKEVLDMARYSSDAGINVSISTNGTLIKGEDHAQQIINSGISLISISLDGVQNNTYNLYRIGGDFEKVLNNIKFLVKARNKSKNKNVRIIVQTVVMKQNEHQRDSLRKTSKDLGVDGFYEKNLIIPANIETEPDKFKEMADNYLPNDINMRSYDLKDGQYVMAGNIHNNCGFIFNQKMMTICSNGNIIPCCHDNNSDYIMGNVFEETLSQIWNNKKFRKFRKAIKKDQASIALCRTCPNAREKTAKSCYYEL